MPRVRDDDPLRKLVNQFEETRRVLTLRLDSVRRESESIRAQLDRTASNPIWPDRRQRARLFDTTPVSADLRSPQDRGSTDQP